MSNNVQKIENLFQIWRPKIVFFLKEANSRLDASGRYTKKLLGVGILILIIIFHFMGRNGIENGTEEDYISKYTQDKLDNDFRAHAVISMEDHLLRQALLEQAKIEAQLNKTRLDQSQVQSQVQSIVEKEDEEDRIWPKSPPKSSFDESPEPPSGRSGIENDDSYIVMDEHVEIIEPNQPAETVTKQAVEIPEGQPIPDQPVNEETGINNQDAQLETNYLAPNEIEDIFKGPDISSLPKEIPIPHRENTHDYSLDLGIDIPIEEPFVENLGKNTLPVDIMDNVCC